jgi:YD repeat-containing protein
MFAALLLSFACQAHRPTAHHAAVEYYAGFTGYAHPLHLVSPLTQEQAEQRPWAYFVARYEGDQLVEAEKRHQGKTVFRHAYAYDSRGRLEEVRSSDDEGHVRTLVRGGDGKLHDLGAP